MAKLVWDATGTRKYQTGIDKVTLYKMNGSEYGVGVAWQGVTALSESPSGAEENALWADNQKYASLYSTEEFGFSITAYDSPVEFDECDGTAEPVTGVTIGAQPRKSFGVSYRSLIGNDTDKNNYGYLLHLVYGATASPSERSHSTVNESPEAEELSWECKTLPIPVEGYAVTAHLKVDSTKVSKAKMEALEGVLWGTDNTDPRLPLPAEVISMIGGDDDDDSSSSSSGSGT